MTQAFLNEPTIEAAHEKYMKRWHLESVQSAWNGRRPSIAQFKKRFGKAYTARQKYLSRGDKMTTVATRSDDQRQDAVQSATEKLMALLAEANETEAILGPEVDDDEPLPAASTLLERLSIYKGTSKRKVEVKDDEPKFVKPENFGELPRSGQLYFFLHRAKEAGYAYAVVPLKRGVAAECISQMKDDGRDYADVVKALVTAKA